MPKSRSSSQQSGSQQCGARSQRAASALVPTQGRNALLMLLLAVCPLAFAETAAEKPSVDVRRVGAHIGCQCGCTDTVATCAMLECSFSKPAKEKIAKLQAGGLTDKTIID